MTKPLLAGLVALLAAYPVLGVHDEELRNDFSKRVNAYVDLHRRLEGPLPPEAVTPNPADLVLMREALATEIRKARWQARQGDIFTPGIASLFRRLVREGIAGVDPFDLVPDPEGAAWKSPAPLHARIHASYPGDVAFAWMPPRVLLLLPPLPPELRYQFIGRDLALWDTHAHLIIDYVPDALPPAIVPEPTTP